MKLLIKNILKSSIISFAILLVIICVTIASLAFLDAMNYPKPMYFLAGIVVQQFAVLLTNIASGFTKDP